MPSCQQGGMLIHGTAPLVFSNTKISYFSLEYQAMRTIFIITGILLFFAACRQEGTPSTVISLTYTQNDIQKQFDTLYDHQQTAAGVYKGITEQALAICHDSANATVTSLQNVFSSMYLNQQSGNYDCVTTTVFQFREGSITATGVFKLTPGDTIAPDHDFPITGGAGIYTNVYGTYTRKYSNGVYRVKLQFYKLP